MARRVSRADMQETELQRAILSMAGKFSAYQIFTDWAQCISLAISNSLQPMHDELWEQREKQYKAIMDTYTEEERARFPEMTAWLVEELEDNPRDVLGEVFMKSGMGSDAGGQFFTPFHLSQLMAAINVTPEPDGKISLLEPSCGSGGGIIAAALELENKGFNYQKEMKVVAQDLDWRCVYMCHVQLSFLGINALVVQGNTLSEPYVKGYPPQRVLKTPAYVGALV